jgi:hypothetical protein
MFGLKTAPHSYQKLMYLLLQGLHYHFVLAYLDDLLIYSHDFAQHIGHITIVFQRIRAANLRINLKKSQFLKPRLEYLGYIITPNGIQPTGKNIQAIVDAPKPSSAKQVKSFLGLVGFYRRFIPNIAKRTYYLKEITREKEPFEWTEDCEREYVDMKTALTTDTILKYPDFNQPFILTVDASYQGLGAILSQMAIDGYNKPIAYASRTLNKHEAGYSTTDLEMQAVVWGIKYFQVYLDGHHFTVFTDHKANTGILKVKDPNSRQNRHIEFLLNYDYDIKHKSGPANHSDFLSRCPIPYEKEDISDDEEINDD